MAPRTDRLANYFLWVDNGGHDGRRRGGLRATTTLKGSVYEAIAFNSENEDPRGSARLPKHVGGENTN